MVTLCLYATPALRYMQLILMTPWRRAQATNRQQTGNKQATNRQQTGKKLLEVTDTDSMGHAPWVYR